MRRCFLVLLFVVLAMIRTPGVGIADAYWLGGGVSWNSPGQALPGASATDPPIDLHCGALGPSGDSVEEQTVFDHGWRFVTTLQAVAGISIVQGHLYEDANCRPVYYQDFVFVDGVFAGTLSPEPMFARTAGALVNVVSDSPDMLTATYHRYQPEDGLCCPSAETILSFVIDRTNDGPVVLPIWETADTHAILDQTSRSMADPGSQSDDLDRAAEMAVYLSRLEATGDFDTLYDTMHPDAKVIIPREAMVGWYTNDWAPLGPEEITVTGVRFVDWTWGVTGTTYLHTAEVSFEQTFADGSVAADEVRLVQDDSGEWRWFFGRDSQFVNEQITNYASSSFGVEILVPSDIGHLNSTRGAECSSTVRTVGDPEWWIVPNTPGWGDLSSGRLWFGVRLENCSATEASAANLLFRAYASDGKREASCSRISPWDLGAGAAANMAPREIAWVTCDAGIFELATTGLQVSARILEVSTLEQNATPDYEILESSLLLKDKQSSPLLTAFGASALVQSTVPDRDTLAKLLFRFYDDQGIHVGNCESAVLVIEPGIARRATCQYIMYLDTASPQPTTVQAVALPCRVPSDNEAVLTEWDQYCGS